jgi:hypothetical protein
MIKQFSFPILLLFITFATQGADNKKVIFSSYYRSPDDFEAFAAQAKKAGATHISISECLPRSFWQYDTPGDPYPGWTVTQLSIIKVATPAKLREFIPADYSDKVLEILANRCRVLRKYGLKASISVTDPAMLPESVYEKFPLWRGPIVSHPYRSRVTRFAPATDDPEVQELYREAMSILLKKCPEINIISVLTNDSGAGLDWSTGLYNGQIGNTRFRNVPMDIRVRTFFESLWAGAADAKCNVDLNIVNTRETNPKKIALTLSKGMAIDNFEGPDGNRFISSAGIGEGYSNAFFPVYGIPQVIKYIDGLIALARSNAPRISIAITDEVNRDLYFKVYQKVMDNVPENEMEKLELLIQISEEIAGKEKSSRYLDLYSNLDKASNYFSLLMAGGYLFNLGCVQQRWLVRPFVPFPDELPEKVYSSYRRFQFQAFSDRLNNLADVQANDFYYGWSGRYFVGKIIDNISTYVENAINIAKDLGENDLAIRLDIYKCILTNAKNAVSYQAQLDRIKELEIKPLEHDVVGTQSNWDRQLIMGTARSEIDNTAILIKLLGNDPGKYLRIATSPTEEDISLLGPDIINQLRIKLEVMNSHWEDYKRIFSTPNL